MSPHVPHPPSACASRVLCHQSRAHWNPLFKILIRHWLQFGVVLKVTYYTSVWMAVFINRETNGLLNCYLTGFTRSLLTNAIGLCQVKAYYTELAAASLYMAVNETNHSQMHLTLTLVVVNDIHSLIMIFMTCPTRVRQRLTAKFRFSLPFP